jgi:hypothetical protein
MLFGYPIYYFRTWTDWLMFGLLLVLVMWLNVRRHVGRQR